MELDNTLQLLIARQQGLQLAIAAIAGSIDPAALASAQASLQTQCNHDSNGMAPHLAQALRQSALVALTPLDR